MLPKDITRGEQTVQGSRKSRVNGHLHNDLHNFLSRAAHMQGGRDMHPELRSRIAQCGQRRHRRYLPIFQIKSGPGVNVSKGKLHKITGKVRRDVPQTFHHSFTTLSVHLTQHFKACLITPRIHISPFTVLQSKARSAQKTETKDADHQQQIRMHATSFFPL